MPGTGTATVDFGPFPGSTDVSHDVAQVDIQAGSLVEAWMAPMGTADHTADEHWVEEVSVSAGNVVQGEGFTIYMRARNKRLHGAWVVAWAWV